ncbi:MAG: GtrA family protein [Clostridium sp.]|uniref:GtrA family protein n=1 Tax=Clostridium sp. TaxID=1506 RepID=UPI003F2C5402
MINEIKKYKEQILYIIFGGATTVINLGVYYIMTRYLNMEFVLSNVVAWIVSVIFAFITNKIFVFNSRKLHLGTIVKECIQFFSSRAFTGGLDIVLLWIMVDYMHLEDMISKVVIGVLIVILNYVISKLYVFKEAEKVERS